ncbi:GerAB/ArcD/ProY family transporter [Heyndrickxia acidicola]|uniref:GerAB/ArcD/ProY family transporter n=1 Tax=Heyndrickxia acidicola TaxID=209389 RepID=A0ABU6MQJ9_9BACI|nr:GerAB/ArcD/ProY family transporter [Heyndrickxia acidicola]MED1205918.1 GerAB/ArcD/ProY family transporter [Heyndrickxia acidicola]
MGKAKISGYQLFVLIVLFEMGTSLVISLGIQAKQDAWLAILLGSLSGLVLFYIYYRLYLYYPDLILTDYLPKVYGNLLGRFFGLLYIVYFLYLSSRVLRDFGELLLAFAYPETPLFIIHALMVVAIIYGVKRGIEVLARTGEIFFLWLYLLAIAGFVLVIVSGLIDMNHLKPMLEFGIKPILKVVYTQTLYVPFGEMIVFTMILPYLNHPKKAKAICFSSIALSGINLALAMAVNVSVLGADVNQRSPFPLLSTIQEIKVASFLERLDVFFMLALIIGSFFKISLYFYASVEGVASVFKIPDRNRLVYPLGVLLLLFSMAIASDFTEHIKEGLSIVPIYFHLPMQVGLPVLTIIIAFFKNRKKAAKKDEQMMPHS